MSDVEGIDFFRSGAILRDPYPYYERLRSRCPSTMSRTRAW